MGGQITAFRESKLPDDAGDHHLAQMKSVALRDSFEDKLAGLLG